MRRGAGRRKRSATSVRFLGSQRLRSTVAFRWPKPLILQAAAMMRLARRRSVAFLRA